MGAFNNTTGVIQSVQIGPRCTTVPNSVLSSNIAFSAYPNSVSLSWTEPPQPADVAAVGIVEWFTAKNSAFYGDTAVAPDWTDANVSPATNYTYSVAPVSFHNVPAVYSTALSITTPTTDNIDPRRTGVKPLGSYWGSSPEQIDVLSGNLNLTVPLLTAQGRGGWTVPISLSYNSQNWKQDSAGVQLLGRDVGYGLGSAIPTRAWTTSTLRSTPR